MSLLVDLFFCTKILLFIICIVYREFYVINCNICNCLILYLYPLNKARYFKQCNLRCYHLLLQRSMAKGKHAPNAGELKKQGGVLHPNSRKLKSVHKAGVHR